MNILIEVMHGLGDVVCALPMIENICLAYPEAEITVLVNSQGAKEIVQNGNFKIAKIVVLNVHKDVKWQVAKTCINLRKEKYDIGISCVLTSVKKAHMFMGVIAPKRKVGIQFSKNLDFSSLIDKMHFVDANLEILSELQINPTVFEPVLIPNPMLVKAYRHMLIKENQKPRIGVCIGNADTTYKYKLIRKKPVYTKGWGIENISVLCDRLIKEDYSLVLFGGKQELSLLEQMPKQIKEKTLSFVGKTTVSESIAIASLCDILVGVDTGMQHIANALGIRTVSIFGPTSPRMCGAYSSKAVFVENQVDCKYCFGTAQYARCKDRKCLMRISVDSVFNMITKVLEEVTVKNEMEEDYE